MRKLVVVTAVVALVTGAAGGIAATLATVSATSAGYAEAERLSFVWTTSPHDTSDTGWQDVGGLNNLYLCARNAFSAQVSVTVSGAPVDVRVLVDDTKPIRPGAVHFDPSAGTTSFSYTFAWAFFPAGGHGLDVQWRSPTGQPAHLSKGTIVATFEQAPSCTSP